jgi:hypothetical protein
METTIKITIKEREDGMLDITMKYSEQLTASMLIQVLQKIGLDKARLLKNHFEKYSNAEIESGKIDTILVSELT